MSKNAKVTRAAKRAEKRQDLDFCKKHRKRIQELQAIMSAIEELPLSLQNQANKTEDDLFKLRLSLIKGEKQAMIIETAGPMAPRTPAKAKIHDSPFVSKFEDILEDGFETDTEEERVSIEELD